MLIRSKKYIIIGTLLTLINACSINQGTEEKNNDEWDQILHWDRVHDSEYWLDVNPVQFLDSLRTYQIYKVVMIEAYPTLEWLDEKYIIELQKYLTDKSPAAIVFAAKESMLHTENVSSTVSIQAKFIIEGIKKKKYPPTLCSYHQFTP